MPDLLAHALLAYALARMASWRCDWLTTPYVTAAMAGAFVPDLIKVTLLVPSGAVEQALGIPFDWEPLRTLGGVAVSILVGAVLVAPPERRRVVLALSLGAVTHLVSDALLLTPSGRSYPILWPLTRYHPPTPGLYLSTQVEPTVVAALLAVGVWWATRYRTRRPER